MNIESLNRMMFFSKIDVKYETNKNNGYITKSSLDKNLADRVCQILKNNYIGYEIVNDENSKVRIAIPKNKIISSSNKTGNSINDQGVNTAVKSVLINLNQCKRVFSWENNNYIKFKNLPKQEEINYKNNYPLFDEKWLPLAERMIKESLPVHKTTTPVLDNPEAYLNRAQVLLNRFLDNNSFFKQNEFITLHPNVMFQALSTAIKTEQEDTVWNNDHANALTSNGQESDSREITKSINTMERLFLKGLKYNISTDIPVEDDLKFFVRDKPLKKSELINMLTSAIIGTYVIQKESDHYVVEVKTGELTFETFAFTFDENKNLIEILPEGSAKSPRSSGELQGLMEQFGGRFLL